MRRNINEAVFQTCLIILFAVLLLPINSYTANAETADDTVYLDDGSYIAITLNISTNRAAGTKTATKTYVYHANDGTEEWRAVLTGSFDYTGSSASCTSAFCSVNIANTKWYMVSKNVYTNSNSALADLVMGYKWLGITTKKVTINLSLQCDANGNLR